MLLYEHPLVLRPGKIARMRRDLTLSSRRRARRPTRCGGQPAQRGAGAGRRRRASSTSTIILEYLEDVPAPPPLPRDPAVNAPDLHDRGARSDTSYEAVNWPERDPLAPRGRGAAEKVTAARQMAELRPPHRKAGGWPENGAGFGWPTSVAPCVPLVLLWLRTLPGIAAGATASASGRWSPRPSANSRPLANAWATLRRASRRRHPPRISRSSSEWMMKSGGVQVVLTGRPGTTSASPAAGLARQTMHRSEQRISRPTSAVCCNAVLTDRLIRRREAGEAVDWRNRPERERCAMWWSNKRPGRRRGKRREQPRVGFRPMWAAQGFGGNPAAAARLYRFPGLLAASPALSEAQVSNAPWRSPRSPTTISRRPRTSAAFRSAPGWARGSARRRLHDGGITRYRRHDHAERPLRQPRGHVRAGAPDARRR